MPAMRRLAWLIVIVVLVVAGDLAFCWASNRIGVAPRRLGSWLEQRSAGHDRAIVYMGELAARALVALDRGRHELQGPLPVPAAALAPVASEDGRSITVTTPADAVQATIRAQPGDTITFAPGTYRFHGAYIDARRPGAAGAPITVRAARAGSAVLEFDMVEGFLVSAPYWTFENLTIRGVCADDSSCEHAFHVVAGATHFTARNNVITDFNAPFKINGSAGRVPDFGIIEGNVLADTRPRQTDNPVTMIDLVAASHWRIVGNRISDFVKAQGDRISYGAFAKGGGGDNRFERNVVVCEHRLRELPGQRVGLSLGGGGTAPAYCRDRRCITEQDRRRHRLEPDRVVFRRWHLFESRRPKPHRRQHADRHRGHRAALRRDQRRRSPATWSTVRSRRRTAQPCMPSANVDTALARLYLGGHPVRRLFDDPLALDLRWRGEPPRQDRRADLPVDLCGASRLPRPAYGAFDDIGRCVAPAR